MGGPSWLGVDFGTVRIGLAWADELGVPVPLPALRGGEGAAERVAEAARARGAGTIVVGYPLNMDGTAGFKAREVDDFIGQLATHFPGIIERSDERLSSHAVKGELSLRRERQLRKSGKIDSAAATLILRTYLEETQLLPEPPDEEE